MRATDFRGWLVLLALAPLIFVVTYYSEPAVRRASFWGDAWKDLPLAQRVGLLPAEAVASLREDLEFYGGVSKVAPAHAAAYVVDDLRQAMAGLPESVKRLVRDRLIGVFLVDNLSTEGTGEHNLGLALEVMGLWRQHVGTIVLIDRDGTDMSANRAMATMEYVPTGEYRGISVQSRLARRNNDDRRMTMQYVLLHELGHVIDYDRGITPDSFNYGERTRDCGFTCLSWVRPDRHRFSPRIGEAMRRAETASLDAYVKALPETFRLLSASNFPSLYATSMPAEDFAESFAQYVHSVVLGHPWELTLRDQGTIRERLGSCFLERRCPGKRSYFDRLLVD
jgi:hypothetical protein